MQTHTLSTLTGVTLTGEEELGMAFTSVQVNIMRQLKRW
jgi:hypothetical protein